MIETPAPLVLPLPLNASLLRYAIVNTARARYASVFPVPVGTHIRSQKFLYSDFLLTMDSMHMRIYAS